MPTDIKRNYWCSLSKCKTHLYSLLLTLNIGHKKGVTPFLLRKGAVLKRSRKKAKEFEDTLGVLDEVDGIHSSQNYEDNANINKIWLFLLQHNREDWWRRKDAWSQITS